MNVVRSFVSYAIIRELCDRMRFEVDCAKSHHRVISEGLVLSCGRIHETPCTGRNSLNIEENIENDILSYPCCAFT